MNGFLGCSPDGITYCEKMVEFKCPLTRIINPKTAIPNYYLPQIQSSLHILELNECDYMEYSTKQNQIILRNVKIDPDWVSNRIEKIDNWLISFRLLKSLNIEKDSQVLFPLSPSRTRVDEGDETTIFWGPTVCTDQHDHLLSSIDIPDNDISCKWVDHEFGVDGNRGEGNVESEKGREKEKENNNAEICEQIKNWLKGEKIDKSVFFISEETIL
jgi:hypothetical protein